MIPFTEVKKLPYRLWVRTQFNFFTFSVLKATSFISKLNCAF